MDTLPPLPLPSSIRQRQIDLTTEPTCGLNIFILEAGDPTNPLILLFHGYLEFCFALAAYGFHVVAPDSRGYGRTTGWDTSSYAHTNLSQFTQSQLILDNLALMRALGHETVALVVGHDFGATAASACAMARPDLFRAAVFLSHVPGGFSGLPKFAKIGEGIQTSKKEGRSEMIRDPDVHTSLARLDTPLKHYQWYNSTATASQDWQTPPQGLKAFLRGYVHLKSHVWKGNAVGGGMGRLTGWTADQLARMPGYYITPLDATMPKVVAVDMQGEDSSLTEAFMSDAELDVYVQEFSRTGFQGMLNWYRSATDPRNVNSQIAIFAEKKFEVPVTCIGGEADWGNYQRPGALEGLESGVTATDYRGTRILAGAGHWPQTETASVVCEEIVKFLNGH